ncbi:beta strand repeat-containing protein [Maribacter cobaltidurans]|nr:hypothetical protein [Maribacter cobaltidurans]
MDKRILWIFLLLSGITFAQTTVTLEDQCNCEVLQGTAVTAAGSVTPSGADLGDLYVNTNTGTIFFWDGDSWELSSTSDNQQVLDFSYNPATRELTLELEDGGLPISATLPAETLTTLALNGNTLEYRDENNVLTTIPLNVGSLSFNSATRELLYIDETGLPTFITLPAEVLTSITDNFDGTFTYNDENGDPTQINKSSLTDLGTGIYSFDNGNGSPIVFVGTDDQTAQEVSFDNSTSSLTTSTVQEALAELDANISSSELTTTVVEGNGVDVTSLTTGNNTEYTVAVNVGELTGDGNISSTNGTIDITGGNASTLNDVTLDVADDAITNAKIADNAITTTEILDGTIGTSDIADNAIDATKINSDIAGTGLVQNGTTGALEVDGTAITGDGNITSGDLTVGGDANALLGDVTLEIAADAVTTTEILDGTIGTSDIADDAIDATKINSDIAGAGLVQNVTTGALEVDGTAINGDGNITSGDLTVGGDANALLGDVTLEIAADAVTNTEILDGTIGTFDIADDAIDATKINSDIAGAGLVQNVTTGALEVDGTAINGDGNITSGDLTVGGDANALLGDVTLEIAADAVTTTEILDGSVGTVDIADDAVALEKLANGTTSGQVMQWDGANWILIDLGSVTVTENDGVIGNEVTDATDGTLVRSGAGTTISPYTLDVAADGITTNEIAPGAVGSTELSDSAVTLGKLADGSNVGDLIQWNGTSWVYIDPSTLDTDTQYTAGDGLNLDGSNEFTAVASPDAGNASEVRANGIFSTDDQTASEVNITDVGGNFTATDVEGALSELAVGSTDDQNLTGATLDGSNQLQIDIEGGTSATVDLSSLVGTDDQNISGSGFNGATNELTIGIEGGTSETVDLSGLVGTDDQTAAEVAYDNSTSGLTAGDIQAAIDEVAAGSTDDQNLTGATLDGSNQLQIDIEGGTSATVDLSSLVGTDDQTAGEVGVTPAGNITSTDVQSALEELDSDITGSELTTTVSEGNGVDIVSSTVGNNTDYEVTVNIGELTGDGNVTSTNGTIDITGGNASTLNDVTLDVADNAITNAKMADNAITSTEILDGTIGASDIADDAVALEKLANGTTSGQVMQWDGANWTLVDLGSVTVTENDGVIGNELTDATDGTLVRSGAGTTVSPYTLDVAADGITTNEIAPGAVGPTDLADSAVTLGKLADGNTAGDMIQWNGTAWTYIDPSTLIPTTTVSNTSAINTLTTTVNGTTGIGVDIINSNVLSLNGSNELVSTVNGQAATALDLSPAVQANQTTTSVVAGGDISVSSSTVGNNTEYTVTNDAPDQTVTLADGGNGNVTIGGTYPNFTIDVPNNTDDQTASEVNIADAGGNFTATDVEGALSELAAGSTDDQNISGSGFNGATNELTIGIEGGTSETVDLSGLVGTDDQTAAEVAYDNSTSGLTAGDVQSAIDEVAAGSTDDQNLTGATLNGSNQLQIDIEGGTSATVDLSSLVGTDDQTASEVNIADAGGNFTATDVEGALSELAADSTDDQNISGSGFNGATNELTIGIEGGTSETVDLSGLVGTDDQTAGEVTYDNSTSGLTAGDVQGAIDEVVAGSTDDQNLTGATLDGSNQLQIDIEGGTSATVDLSSLVGTDDQNISGSSFNGATNELTIGIEGGTGETVDLSGLVGTDDQNLTGATLDGSNQLQIDIEGGNSATVDLSSLVGTDDQTAGEVTVADVGGNFANTEVEGVLEEIDARIDALVLAGGSDGNDFVTGGSLSGTDLTLNVPNQIDPVIDLSGLQDGTGTDDQNISGSSFNGATNELTIGIEGGTGETVDLSGLVGTDDQNLTGATLDGSNQLQIDIEGGTSATVDLSSLLGTDDQTASEVNITDADGNFTATDVEGALSELAAGSTDNQDISTNGTPGNISIDNGSTINLNVNDADSDATNEIQDLSISGNTLSLSSDATTVDLSGYLDNTDSQTLSVAGNDLSIVGGNTVTLPTATGAETIVNSGTNINVTGSGTSGDPYVVNNTFTEVDGSTTNEVNTNFTVNGTNLEITDSNGTLQVPLADINAGVNTDNQDLTLSGNTLAISGDPNTDVDLSGYLDNTDSQTLSVTGNDLSIAGGNTVTLPTATGAETIVNSGTNINVTGTGTSGDPYVVNNTFTEVDGSITNEIQDLSISGNTLSLSGDATTVDLSGFVNTDSQTLSLSGTDLSITGGNTIDIGSIDTDTDDQTLSLTGNTLAIADGNSVDLSGFVNTDNQQISLSTNTLTLSNGTGTDTTADLSGYLDNTDSQTLSVTGNDLSITGGNTVTLPTANGSETIVNGGGINIVTGSGTSGDPYVVTGTEVDGSVTNEIQDLSLSANTLSLSSDATTVDLSGYLDNTDSQTLSVAGNDLSIVGGNTVTLPTATGAETIVNSGTNINVTGTGTSGDPYVVNNTFTEVDGSITNEIQDLSISGNTLSLSGDATTVDLSGFVNTDSQTLSLSGTDLSVSGGNTIDISSIDTDTDDQTLSLTGNTLAIADGNSVDLSGFVNTDNQDLSLSGNTLSLSGDATTVDLGAYLDNTDSQTLSVTGNDLSIAGGNTVTLPTATGAETIVNSGTNINVTGSGTSGDPYVVNNTFTELDGSTTNEVNTNFTVNGTNLEITDSNGTLQVPLADITSGVNTDSQTLSLTGTDLSITGGNSIDIGSIDTDTDDQTLSLTGNTLAIADGNSVDLSGFVNTDNQDISTNGSAGNISIDNGSTLTLNVNDADSNPNNEIQDLSLSTNTLSLSGDATTVDLSGYLDNTDDQIASEVNSDTPIDVDGDGTNEATVEDVIQAIAPITSKAARVFYPPSIAIDASTPDPGTNRTINLYDQYIAQFGSPVVSSGGTIPTYAANELDYHVTYADPDVFGNGTTVLNMSVSPTGVLTYRIYNTPPDYNALINVVFVVK